MKFANEMGFMPDVANINLRISVATHQGGRKYMEDEYAIVHYQYDADAAVDGCLQKSFLFLGIFDGHGGGMASRYTRENLCRNIVRQKLFWSDDDQKVCLAIHKGFVRTQKDIMNEVDKWPKTAMGLPSTSGTTASVLFVMNGKYYTGHVGDSRIVLGRKTKHSEQWRAHLMTRDHKPESPRERRRIEAHGGKVINKSGVGRVVWNRPRRSFLVNGRPVITYDMIPFLSVARSLGDLWSLNENLNKFTVSPEPDVKCVPIDPSDRCIILASDGLWNVINPMQAVDVIQDFEEEEEDPKAYSYSERHDVSHSKKLLDHCLMQWRATRFRADNTTVLVAMFGKSPKDQMHNVSYYGLNHEVGDSDDIMIGDTIHSYKAFDPKEIDEKFIDSKTDDENEIVSLLNDILNSCCNDVETCHYEPKLNFHTDQDKIELIDDRKLYSTIDFERYLSRVDFQNCIQAYFKCKIAVQNESLLHVVPSSPSNSESISELSPASSSSSFHEDIANDPTEHQKPATPPPLTYSPYKEFLSRDFKISHELYEPSRLIPIYYDNDHNRSTDTEYYRHDTNDHRHAFLENKLLNYKKRKLFEYSASTPEFLKRQCTVNSDHGFSSIESSSVANNATGGGGGDTANTDDETTKDSCIKEYLSSTKVHNFSIPHHIGKINDQVLASNQ